MAKEYNYAAYESNELKEERDELQRKIDAINLELANRRGDLVTAIQRKLVFIFQQAKENGITIEIGTQEMYMSYNPAEDTITDIIVQ